MSSNRDCDILRPTLLKNPFKAAFKWIVSTPRIDFRVPGNLGDLTFHVE